MEWNLKMTFNSMDIIIKCLFIIVFSLLLSASYDILLPVNSIIPLNIQFIIVLFIGVTLQNRYGCVAVLLYFLLGLIPCPLFSYNTQGIHFFTNIMGGFQLGLIPFVILMGVNTPNKSVQSLFKQSIFSQVLFFSIGIFVFYAMTRPTFSWTQILSMGIVPFIPVIMINTLFVILWYKCLYPIGLKLILRKKHG